MADILIRNMEMPQDSRITIQIGADGTVYLVEKCTIMAEKYKKSSHAIPLPEGHGDLIDRDALKKRTPMVIDYSAGGFGTDGSIRPVRGYGDWQIDQASTIVPAEGGDTDGN